MKNRDRNNLLLGVLAGAAIGYWLNSDQGRITRTKAAEVASEGLSTAKTVAVEQIATVKDTAGELVAQGIEATQNALNTVQTKTTTVSDIINDSFEKGVSKAKKKVAAIEGEIASEALNLTS